MLLMSVNQFALIGAAIILIAYLIGWFDKEKNY